MKNKKTFLLLITLSIILAYFAAEIYLPAMPQLQRWLGVSTSELQLTISVYFLGVGTAQFIGGPIIDRFNYRTIAIIMGSVFIIASIYCAAAFTLYQLIIARLFQAFSAGILAIIGRASLTRNFDPNEVTHIYLFVSPILSLSLTFSPLIGGYLTHYFHWHSVFIASSILGLLLTLLIFFYLPSDKKQFKKIKLHPITIAKTYFSLVINKTYLSAVCVTTTIFAMQLSYITETPFIFSRLNYSSQAIGTFYITLSLAFIIGSWLARQLKRRYPYAKLIYIGFAWALLGTLSIYLLTLNGTRHAYELFLPSIFIGIGNGILIPIGTAKAISIFTDKAGYASGLLSAVNLIAAAAIASPVNLFTQASARWLALYMTAILLIGLLTFSVLASKKFSRCAT
ncbi:MAG: Bcr/CflA family efflux MFS transporter [Pseudomonadota bacterium]